MSGGLSFWVDVTVRPERVTPWASWTIADTFTGDSCGHIVERNGYEVVISHLPEPAWLPFWELVVRLVEDEYQHVRWE